jgi:hypothetical protein
MARRWVDSRSSAPTAIEFRPQLSEAVDGDTAVRLQTVRNAEPLSVAVGEADSEAYASIARKQSASVATPRRCGHGSAVIWRVIPA